MTRLVQSFARWAGYSLHRLDVLRRHIKRQRSDAARLAESNKVQAARIEELTDLISRLEQDRESLQNRTAIQHRKIVKLDEKTVEMDTRINNMAQTLEHYQAIDARFGWIWQYISWSEHFFGHSHIPIARNVKAVASFDSTSPYFNICSKGIVEAEMVYVQDLVSEIKHRNIEGEIVEFGIYKGAWINHLYKMTQKAGLEREIWGFDSFEGLSRPHSENDDPFWQEGMFSAGISEVKKKVKFAQRPNLRLVPGWFSDSLVSPVAQDLHSICFARIDCDIYEPAVDCLKYLGPRLSHGSVLVFDDWSYDTRTGETRAFVEWTPTVPHLEFEFLFFGHWDHYYIRVWHKGRDRDFGNVQESTLEKQGIGGASKIMQVETNESSDS